MSHLVFPGASRMQFSKLSDASLEHMVEGAELLEADNHGPKVYRLRDGNFLKLFRRKRLLSSAFWSPYSKRFCESAVRLHRLGIPTLTPLQLFRLDDPARTAVLYQPLPGRTLRQLAERPGFDWNEVFPDLVKLISQLHRQGVYFRSLHLGNIVQTPSGQLGLIDISDMRFLRRALSRSLARRNLQQFHRYLQREKLEGSFPYEMLCNALFEARRI